MLGWHLHPAYRAKKFKASEANVDRLQKENSATLKKLNESEMQSMKLKNEKTLLEKEYASIQNDLMLLSSESKITIKEQGYAVKRTSEYHSISKRQNNQTEKFNFKGTVKL